MDSASFGSAAEVASADCGSHSREGAPRLPSWAGPVRTTGPGIPSVPVTHRPAEHTSSGPQAGLVRQPSLASHQLTSQAPALALQSTASPVQRPFVQLSASVQASPSSQKEALVGV